MVWVAPVLGQPTVAWMAYPGTSTRWAMILAGAGTRSATPPRGLGLLPVPLSGAACAAGVWAIEAWGNSPAQIPACPSPQ
eukprot:5509513-Prorocentrum_lima.AAC.1